MKPIVVVGSINMDLVSRVERIPRPGETVLGSDFQLHSGGKGANQAVAVARLGYPVVLLGKVGNDIFAAQLRQTLQDYGVDIQHVETVEGASGNASIAVDAQGENSIIVTPAANQQVTPAYLESNRHLLEQAGMVLAQLEIPRETVYRLAEICDKAGVPLMLDPAPASQFDPNMLRLVSWFTPNQTEARFYGEGATSQEAILERLLGAGIRNVILKNGSEGAVLAGLDGRRISVKAFPVQAVDTTAAGDSFNGAFAVGMMSGWGEERSLRFAAAAAGISVSRVGAQPSLANLQEVNALLADHPS